MDSRQQDKVVEEVREYVHTLERSLHTGPVPRKKVKPAKKRRPW